LVPPRLGIHEADFCSQIASQVNQLVQAGEPISPISEGRVEGFGTGTERLKRKDLRFFNTHGKLILCGEVKLPGTAEGRSPYDAKLCRDAEQKAENANIQFFFTWNVNRFVLWDRSLWDRPFFERRVREWQLERTLSSPEDVAVEDNLKFIKSRFLPNLLRDVADIISERREDWSFPPDDIFIRSLESHLEWPVQLLGSYILEQSDRSKAFGARVEQWMLEHDWIFVRSQPESWIKAVDNMAKTLAYVWSNRLIFYKALVARFPNLPRLELRPAVKTPADAVAALNRFFRRAVERSGDYEPLLMPEARDWATSLIFQPPKAIDAWRGLLSNVASIDFSEVPSDVVGRIFQKLIGPEERHRYGQHFTGDDVVDLINSFCIQEAQDAILDPACGSGSFLVRAYYRKRTLDPSRIHLELISELFGCDIALYPAHLATLNLAAREINDEANYPRIVRKDFFDVAPDRPFCTIPEQPPKQRNIMLPQLDVIVGNPPYVRQEKIEKEHKERYSAMASAAWPDLKLSGRSDLHCYFWPVATRLLRPDGYFGFLTSSSWLDVEYGFELQGWILRHFRILAIMESAAEPWFEDARVKTCITILQRCENELERMANKVRFVRFSRELANIMGTRDEVLRQAATDALRQRILSVEENYQDQDLRIIVKTQKELWDDGIRASTILASGQDALLSGEPDEEDAAQAKPQKKFQIRAAPRAQEGLQAKYCAGKWGRYLRAPDFYFEVMRRFGKSFVPLGEIADIRFGVKSGCDAFFMPKDVTRRMLVSFTDEREFRRQTGGAPRKEVEAGRLKIIEAGDGSVHPIEANYIAPELHSPMEVDRPVVRANDLDRVVLLAGEPMGTLKSRAPWVWRYLRYGSEATFESSKSRPAPLPKRSTIAARETWYNLKDLVKPGIAFWPKAQQYRHIIPQNPDRIICNCNLYDLAAYELSAIEKISLLAILNSTAVGLFKTFYGRFAGTEGNLKTEVVDVNLMEVPDPRGIPPILARKFERALAHMSQREVGRLVEEQLMDCHDPERARQIGNGPIALSKELCREDRRALDDAVFELLGVRSPEERKELVNRLYEATARHFRDIRVVEIEKMEQRSKSGSCKISAVELAEDIWDALDLKDKTPLKEWLEEQPESDVSMSIPEERPVFFPDNPLFELKTVSFGKDGKIRMDNHSKEQASLVFRVAELGLIGEVKLPSSRRGCADVIKRLNERFEIAQVQIKELAESRTTERRLQNQLVEALERWYVQGHERSTHEPPPAI
jgi:methylase of polypeptide subunit release factors